MKRGALEEAVKLGKEAGNIFVATTDGDGMPHQASAGEISLAGEDRVALSEWFCPGTVSNLQVNPRVSIVVWNPVDDCGYQLLGRSEKIEDEAIMDGYSPHGEKNLPQVRSRLFVRVEKIINFSRSPHSDVEP